MDDRRLELHMAADEAALSEIRGEMRSQRQLLEKIERNHLAHMEPDIRELKGSVLRIERAVEGIGTELKLNSADTQQTKLDMANLRGDVNARIAAIESADKSDRGSMDRAMAWLWELVKMILGALVGAAVVLFMKQ